MKKPVYILFASILISCSSLSNKKDNFENRTYEIINICNLEEFRKISCDYSIFEFLDNNRLVSEAMYDSTIIQMQGNWNYYKKSNKEYLVLEELEQNIDTFELICNENFEYFEFINGSGDTIKCKEIIEEKSFDKELLINSKWISTNDSLQIRINKGKYEFVYIVPKYHFLENGTYEFDIKNKKNGKWKFNKLNNRIFLDSLESNLDIITIKKLTVDSLVFWKRNYRGEPRQIVCIKEIKD
ncbi:MAG: hypothetical protein HPY60_10665 [Candidatus Methanofastidiosum sp.]|nr:hypothetical protein [Methanofastidiosum sp.]